MGKHITTHKFSLNGLHYSWAGSLLFGFKEDYNVGLGRVLLYIHAWQDFPRIVRLHGFFFLWDLAPQHPTSCHCFRKFCTGTAFKDSGAVSDFTHFSLSLQWKKLWGPSLDVMESCASHGPLLCNRGTVLSLLTAL